MRTSSFPINSGDIFGGLSGMLVALPAAIAYGLVVFAPAMGSSGVSGAMAGILGAVVLGITGAALGGTPKLVSAPCAPAAAVLAAFVIELTAKGVPGEVIPFLLLITGALTGFLQWGIGLAGGGKVIKFIPYPVVAGYLSAVALIIITGQMASFFGSPKGTGFFEIFLNPGTWQVSALITGLSAAVSMALVKKFLKGIPATLVALIIGTGVFLIQGVFNPLLLTLDHNSQIIGAVASGGLSAFPVHLSSVWTGLSQAWNFLPLVVMPSLTLAVLLSIDTLKTCVVLDAITHSRHDSNKELRAQGIGNFLSSLLGGMVGAGTAGASLINVQSGAKSRSSGVISGVFSLLVFLVLGALIAWIPTAALAGMLFIAAWGMIDFKMIRLLFSRRTIFDFLVIIGVVTAALTASLIAAAGVGMFMTVLIFLREQIRQSVVRRLLDGTAIHSKRNRLKADLLVLETRGHTLVTAELQGNLFFGTTDKLMLELKDSLDRAEYLILDMRRVQGIDYSAAHLLMQIRDRLAQRNGILVFSSIPEVLSSGQHVKAYLRDLGLGEELESLKFFPSLDTALEWAENQILIHHGTGIGRTDRELSLSEIELFEGIPPLPLVFLEMAMESKRYEPGDQIFGSGDKGDSLIFIRRGCVRVDVPLGNGLSHHLATFTQGDFFGDMSFLDQQDRSADAVAETEVSVFILGRQGFDDFVRRELWAGEMLYQRLAYILAIRLRRNNLELKALQEM